MSATGMAFRSNHPDVLKVPEDYRVLRNSFIEQKNAWAAKWSGDQKLDAIALQGFRIEVVGLLWTNQGEPNVPGFRLSATFSSRKYGGPVLVPDKRYKAGKEASAEMVKIRLKYQNEALPGMPHDFWGTPRGGASGIPIYHPSAMFFWDGYMYVGWPVDAGKEGEDRLRGEGFEVDEKFGWERTSLSMFYTAYEQYQESVVTEEM